MPQFFLPHYGPGVDSDPYRNKYKEYLRTYKDKITNKDKIYQKGQNYQKSFLMEVVYLRYILVVLAAECTMFAVRYYCHITFKS